VTGLLEALRPVAALVLGVLLDLLRQRARPTCRDGDTDRATRDRLRDQVRKHFSTSKPKGLDGWPILLVPLLLAGCTRTIYVPHGTPVRLRETVRNVKVWVKDADGRSVPGNIDLPEGWYALPLTDM
jgi:hypothetical protein